MSVEWMVIRGSGVVAYGMLAASAIWGLLLTTKVLVRWAKAKPLTWFHESLAVGALLATIVHIVALSIHEYVEFDWVEILVPGKSDWRPLAVSFGIVGIYGAFLLSISFYFKKLIGHRAWRAIHFGSFGTFMAVTLHGILSGTDTSEPWMIGIYVGSAACVSLLIAIRLAQQYASDETRRQTTRAHRSIESDSAPRSLDYQRKPDRHQRPTQPATGP